MSAAVATKPTFVFVHSEGGTNRSKLSRSIVRSQAARSARSAAKKSETIKNNRDATLSRNTQITISPVEDVDDEVVEGNVVPAKDGLNRLRTPLLLMDPSDPLIATQPLLSNPVSKLLLDHYLSNMAVDIPELDVGTPGLLRSRWFPFALSNHSALLHIIILTAGANYSNYITMAPEQTQSVRHTLVQLKQQALKQMRQMAFAASDHASDDLVAAATKMASFEAMYGSSAAFQTHMAGLKHLVDMRGGIQGLGLGGLLGRMVCWVDCNSSSLLGSPLCFVDLDTMLPKPMVFDPEAFIGGT